LAVHFEQGRDSRKAVQYLELEGKNAIRRSANEEAVSHLTKGLELLRTLPDTPERAEQELTLQLALGDALVAVKGYTASEVEEAVTRARELCQQLEETPRLFAVLGRLVLFYMIRGELQTTRELARQMMRLAQHVQDPHLLSRAHIALGCTLSELGELASARLHLEQAVALYDPQMHPRTTVAADPRVYCLSFAAWTLWHLGYPDQALKRSQEALDLAAELSHLFSLVCALGLAALFHLHRREGQLARALAEAVITLATEQGFPYWLARGMVRRGEALAERGQMEEGIAQMHQGLAGFRARRQRRGG
jgi:tetratricopeptide (TPR) repeat protein